MVCKSCGSDNTCHSQVESEEVDPSEGDISICMNCTALCVFKGSEMTPLSVDQRVQMMMEYPNEWDKVVGIQSTLRKLKEFNAKVEAFKSKHGNT